MYGGGWGPASPYGETSLVCCDCSLPKEKLLWKSCWGPGAGIEDARILYVSADVEQVLLGTMLGFRPEENQVIASSLAESFYASGARYNSPCCDGHQASYVYNVLYENEEWGCKKYPSQSALVAYFCASCAGKDLSRCELWVRRAYWEIVKERAVEDNRNALTHQKIGRTLRKNSKERLARALEKSASLQDLVVTK